MRFKRSHPVHSNLHKAIMLTRTPPCARSANAPSSSRLAAQHHLCHRPSEAPLGLHLCDSFWALSRHTQLFMPALLSVGGTDHPIHERFHGFRASCSDDLSQHFMVRCLQASVPSLLSPSNLCCRKGRLMSRQRRRVASVGMKRDVWHKVLSILSQRRPAFLHTMAYFYATKICETKLGCHP